MKQGAPLLSLLRGLLLSGLMGTAAMAQHTTARKGASTPAPAHTETLAPNALHTDTLNYGDDLERIYVGDFESVSFKHDSQELSLIVSSYMTQYSYSCAQHLPKDKVEIMTTECTREAYTVNGYGVERAGSRHCVADRIVGTGRYADPQVHALSEKLGAGLAAGMMSDLINGLQKGGDPSGGMKKMTDVVVYVKEDMSHFLEDNGCASPAIMRFQENLLRFGRNEDPARMVGAANALSKTTSMAKGQDYKRMIDELIQEESRAWMMNRYQAGSVSVNAVQHDSGGNPKEIDAGYSFVMLGSTAVGNVRVTFASGLPECLYFADAPSACRAPNPKILSQYKRNLYADASAPAYPEFAPDPPRVARSQPGGSTAYGSTPISTVTPANSIAARQAAMRAGMAFGLPVQTLEAINETNAGLGTTVRARLQSPLILKHAEVPAGATVYLKVALERRAAGAAAHFDMYELSVAKIVANGQTLVLISEPIRMTRHSMTHLDARLQTDPTAIAAGTSMTFSCKEATAQ